MTVAARSQGESSVREVSEVTCDRRGAMRASAAWLMGLSALCFDEKAEALQTTSSPRDFLTDYEKYKDSPGSTIGPSQMGRMRGEFRDLCRSKLMAAVPKMPGAYPGLLKLAFLDATGMDMWQNTRSFIAPTGGANGSVIFEKERAELQGMGPLIDALATVKSDIDGEWAKHAKDQGSPRAPIPISWADLITMAAVVATIQHWDEEVQTPFPVRQGRVDAVEADPKGRTLAFDAEISEVKAWFVKRNIKLNHMVPLWMELADSKDGLMADADCSELMATYEANPAQYKADFIFGFTQLTSLGSEYDAYAYFYDESPIKGKIVGNYRG